MIREPPERGAEYHESNYSVHPISVKRLQDLNFIQEFMESILKYSH